MHTVWKGAISFGLVHVPVKMFAATEDNDISFRTLHKTCSSPITQSRSCSHCGTKVDSADTTKGYEYESGKFVIFGEEELEAMKPESARVIQIMTFVDLIEIDPIYFEKSYYLSPDMSGGGAYNLLLEAIRQTGKIGIAMVSIRNKSRLAAIRVIDNCISMVTMHFPDEIRPSNQVPNLSIGVNVNDNELKIAKMLIEQLTEEFQAEKYIDEYRVALQEAINKKVAGQSMDIVSAPATEGAKVVDLMAALQASLDATKSIKKAKAKGNVS